MKTFSFRPSLRHVDPPFCGLCRRVVRFWIPHTRHWYLPTSILRIFNASSKLTVSPSLASGLYYLSELVEEHTVFTKKLLTRIIYGIITIQILLALVDRFPPLLSLLSIGSHAVYAGNLRYFPTVRLTDPILILSCGNNNIQLSPSSRGLYWWASNYADNNLSLGLRKSFPLVSALLPTAFHATPAILQLQSL